MNGQRAGIFDLVNHRIHPVGGDDFFGHPLEDGRVSPELFLKVLHVEDRDHMVATLEQITHLLPAEELKFTLRFEHAQCGTVRADYTARPVSFAPDGTAVEAHCECDWQAIEG